MPRRVVDRVELRELEAAERVEMLPADPGEEPFRLPRRTETIADDAAFMLAEVDPDSFAVVGLSVNAVREE